MVDHARKTPTLSTVTSHGGSLFSSGTRASYASLMFAQGDVIDYAIGYSWMQLVYLNEIIIVIIHQILQRKTNCSLEVHSVRFKGPINPF